jgi:hypothetical protein
MLKPYLKLSKYYLVWCLAGMIIYLLLKQFPYIFDLTHNKQRTLSETTIGLLQKISSPIALTLYSDNSDKLIETQSLVQLYQQHHVIDFKRARPMGGDKLKVTIGTKNQEISLLAHNLSEAILTKTIFETYRKENQWVAFLQGHGEPKPFGDEKTDLGWFAQALKNQGLKVQGLPLYETQVIPDNTQLLVIANPKTELLPKEIELIRDYIQAGHHLLWLSGPDEHTSLSPLLAELGLQKLPGTVVDEHGYKMGTPHPAITIIDKYPHHVATQALNDITAFPWAAAFKPSDLTSHNLWQATPILTTHDNTWTEKGSLMAPVQFDREQQEVPGPLHIGFALHQPKKEGGEQKIVVIGTSKFLTNSAIANYGNLSLGIMLTNWLSADAGLLNIPYPVAKDLTLQLTPWTGWMLEYGLRGVLPILILLGLFLHQFRRYTRSMHYSKIIKS